MKNQIYLLAIVMLTYACGNEKSKNSLGNSNVSPIDSVRSEANENGNTEKFSAKVRRLLIYNCLKCDDTANHSISPLDAAKLIRAYQTEEKFKNIPFCGGTIFTKSTVNSAEVKSIKFLNGYPTFKFHYCSIEKLDVSSVKSPKMTLYLSFDSGECSDGDPSTRKPGVNQKTCSVPEEENYLPRFSEDELSTEQNLYNALIKHKLENGHNGVLNQEKKKADVEIAISNLKLSKLYTNYIQCDDYEGEFRADSSIKQILQPNDGTTVYGFRYYFGLSIEDILTNSIRVILVGVDKDGKNLGIWKETSMPHRYQ